ncbi:MAG: glycoside hydrolase family 25 protein [Bacteroidaceae bacterium]|nr:glycoside hydrolase family 25 protein [Bacteroidaceae bacterium]
MIAPYYILSQTRIDTPMSHPLRWRSVAVATVLLTAWCMLYYHATRSTSDLWQAIYRNQGLPDGFEIRGIDVSHYQGDINWERVSHTKVMDSPISFAIMKATEGVSIVDDHFITNFRESRRHGMIRGAYHFFTPDEPASSQAAHFIRRVRLEKDDLPPVLDIETIGNLSGEELHDAVLTFLLLVEDYYGAKPILYTNLNFKQRYLNSPDFESYPFWIAHYYVKNVGWQGEWHFWQHTDRGRLPGIQTLVDFDVFNGSMYALKQLCVKSNN